MSDTTSIDAAAAASTALATAIAAERAALLASIPAEASAADILAATADNLYISPKHFADALNGGVSGSAILAALLAGLLGSLDARYLKLIGSGVARVRRKLPRL